MTNSERSARGEVGLHEIEKGNQRALFRWLAKRINLLGNAIGYDLELKGPVEIESLYWFYLEVCARNFGRGAIAVAAAETDASGHWTLGSLMTTVSVLGDARFLVWVAPAFHQAHIAALKWLDRITVDNVRILGVEARSEFRVITD